MTDPQSPVTTADADAADAEELTIGGEAIPPGTRRHVELPVSRLPTETWLSIPIEVLRGPRPGPVLWLTAAVHGDELNGVEIIRRVLAAVKPKGLTGTLIAVPIVNVFGFNAQSRYLPDRRDLNRCFPGRKNGSLASRLASLLMTEVVAHGTHGIDLHTGSDHRFNLPQIRANLEDPETLRIARAFDAPVTLHAGLRDGSLRQAATEVTAEGEPTRPVLLYEAGEPLRFDEECLAIGTAGVLNVMRLLGMLPDSPADGRPGPGGGTLVADSSRWVRAKRSGIFRMSASLGDRVGEGDKLGVIADAFGRNRSAVRAPNAGIVIASANNPLVHRGDGVVHIAKLRDGETAAPEAPVD